MGDFAAVGTSAVGMSTVVKVHYIVAVGMAD